MNKIDFMYENARLQYMKKSSIIYLIVIFILVLGTLFFFPKKAVNTEDKELSEKTKEVVSREDSKDNVENKIEILDNNGNKLVVDDYSVSPNGRFALARSSNKFFILNLESNKKLTNDYYFINGIENFSPDNHRWLNGGNILVVVNSWSAFGGEGFPGILQVDLEKGTFNKIVNRENECSEPEFDSWCLSSYSFAIVKLENNILTYREFVADKEPLVLGKETINVIALVF